MACSNCGGSTNTPNAICITIDGDFVCSRECLKKYEHKKNVFLNEILPDDDKYQQWLKGEI